MDRHHAAGHVLDPADAHAMSDGGDQRFDESVGSDRPEGEYIQSDPVDPLDTSRREDAADAQLVWNCEEHGNVAQQVYEVPAFVAEFAAHGHKRSDHHAERAVHSDRAVVADGAVDAGDACSELDHHENEVGTDEAGDDSDAGDGIRNRAELCRSTGGKKESRCSGTDSPEARDQVICYALTVNGIPPTCEFSHLGNGDQLGHGGIGICVGQSLV